jgi:hypothetical protein
MNIDKSKFKIELNHLQNWKRETAYQIATRYADTTTLYDAARKESAQTILQDFETFIEDLELLYLFDFNLPPGDVPINTFLQNLRVRRTKILDILLDGPMYIATEVECIKQCMVSIDAHFPEIWKVCNNTFPVTKE